MFSGARDPFGAFLALSLVVALAGCGIFSTGGDKSDENQTPVVTPPPELPAPIETGPPKCPVDGAGLSDREQVAYVHEGRTIQFCSRRCCEEFKADPARFAQPPRSSSGISR
ncbi:MAG: YHS domain-containing protein [Planctomycetes bacterium]|nr:YHS domain-containing protein [Planctomycetota bacterium]